MKKIFYLAICAMAVLFASCEQNEPSKNNNGSSAASSSSYLITGEATDVTSTSAVVYAEVKVNISENDLVEYGVLYSADKNKVESRSASKQLSSKTLLNGKYSITLSGLSAETQYYYCAFICLNNKQYFGEIKSFTTLETITTGVLNGHEWVDLGLPSGLKWATCNVGASKPEEYGDYFAWGEVKPKKSYYWDSYKWCNGSYSTLTKYNNRSDYGSVDNKTTLELADDAARANWGSTWRMPTVEELYELCDNCSWIWTKKSNNGEGYVVTGPNGNNIFLPAAGYREKSSRQDAGSKGYYWSSSFDEDYIPHTSEGLYFDDYEINGYVPDRYYGFSIRPVCK